MRAHMAAVGSLPPVGEVPGGNRKRAPHVPEGLEDDAASHCLSHRGVFISSNP